MSETHSVMWQMEGHPGAAPPVKNENTRTCTWTRTSWFADAEESQPSFDGMETFEPKSDWQGKVSLSAPFTNPITRFMASFYLTSEQQNEQLRTHMEKVDEGCQRVMMMRLAQNPRDDKYMLKDRAQPAGHFASVEAKKNKPLMGGMEDHLAKYSR
jgi:hypothetical protein